MRLRRAMRVSLVLRLRSQATMLRGSESGRTFLQQRLAARQVTFFGSAVKRGFAAGGQAVGIDAE
jgi:hypothetical protein